MRRAIDVRVDGVLACSSHDERVANQTIAIATTREPLRRWRSMALNVVATVCVSNVASKPNAEASSVSRRRGVRCVNRIASIASERSLTVSRP